MTTPGPFITPDDEYQAQSKSPRVIGQMKLSRLEFQIDMTDEEMQAICAEAKMIRDAYKKWDEFYKDIDLRKKRNMGFKAAVLALDLQQAAAAMGTTPQKIANVMMAYSAAEDARIRELEQMWKNGELPDRDVLGDPSKDIIEDKPTPVAPSPVVPPPVTPPVEEPEAPEPPVEEPVMPEPPVEPVTPVEPPTEEEPPVDEEPPTPPVVEPETPVEPPVEPETPVPPTEEEPPVVAPELPVEELPTEPPVEDAPPVDVPPIEEPPAEEKPAVVEGVIGGSEEVLDNPLTE